MAQDGTGKPADRRPVFVMIALVLAAFMVASHLLQAAYFYWPSGQFKNLHLGLSLILVFLFLARDATGRRQRLALLAGAVLSLVPLVYIHAEYEALVSERMFGASNADVGITVLLVALTFAATVKQWGWTLPLISGAALLYGYFGNWLPGDLLYHSGLGLSRLAGYTAIPFFQGMLGSLTGLSATLIFIFMLYAGLLQSTGGIRFVLTMGRAIGGRARSGPAQIAVIGSGFMGMISGSTVGNVASTGVMTIPLMKRAGYPPAFAGAVEAAASTGGQFTPPVMGLTAFLIVGITGIPYNEIMLAAVLPSIVYYGYLMCAVHIQALKDDVGAGAPVSEAPVHGDDADLSLVQAARRYGHLLLSIAVLVWLLLIRMPPSFAAMWAIAVVAVTELAKQLLVNRHAPFQGFLAACRILFDGLVDGARNGAQLAIIIAIIGILVDIMVVTGFAQKLSHLMLALAAGSEWVLLGLAAISCLVFGLGMPTPAAYILVALLGAPALVKFGVPLLAAHMFVFYFANMSAITPPVAVAALVASKLAEARYFATALSALRLGLPGFILPFMFVYKPELLLLRGSFADQVAAAGVILVAVCAANMVFAGFALRRLRWPESLLLGAAVFGIFYPSALTSIAGCVTVFAVLGRQAWQARKRSTATRNNRRMA